MTLHVHNDLLDCIDDSAVVKDFVACNEVRKDIFWKGAKFAGSVGHPMTKNAFSFRGLRPPDPLTRGSPLDPTGGSAPRAPL